VPAAEYLSGNVRGKLRAAEQACREDARLRVLPTSAPPLALA